MARQRRGGGFRPPELRGTLGTLLRTTLAQAGTLRDVLERGAREGRSRLDSALSGRRRQDALAELGDVVLDLIRRGEIDLGELPEVRDIVAHLDDIDAGTYDDDHAAVPSTDDDFRDDRDADAEPRASRDRFDTRRSGPPPSRTRRGAPDRDHDRDRDRDRDRPIDPAERARPAARDGHDDGTVSSRTWSRPAGAPAVKPPPRVWRPPIDEIAPPSTPSARRSSQEIGGGTSHPAARHAHEGTPPDHPTRRKDPMQKGGIHFDDDEDLAEFMHPDDVPPKTPGDAES